MNLKYLPLTPPLYEYVLQHSGALDDELLSGLRERTAQLGDISVMQIAHDQGSLLSVLALGARSALEIGTFTGYSAICIARSLAPGGRLICLDVSDEWTAIAREFWQRGGLTGRIDLRLGPALESLDTLTDETFDFVFIDADKPNYDAYYEAILPRVTVGGMIIFDNMLWHGRVLDMDDQDETTVAIRALNDKLVADTRVVSGLISVGDGLHICRKI